MSRICCHLERQPGFTGQIRGKIGCPGRLQKRSQHIVVIARTYGCVIFQESVMGVVAVTGWSDAEVERFKKSLTRYTLT